MHDPHEDDPADLIDPLPVDPAAESFFAGAISRIRRVMIALTLLGTALSWIAWGWPIAVGVLLGCIVSYANFYWLERALSALADRVTHDGAKTSSTGTVFRFLLRYVFIGVGAYVIFRSSPASLYGFLGGLSLTVAAILCEAAYESYAALRSKF